MIFKHICKKGDKYLAKIIFKEGEGEKLIKDKNFNFKRFFAFWKKQELLDLFKEKFDLIEFGKTNLGHTIFLKFFFRKL